MTLAGRGDMVGGPHWHDANVGVGVIDLEDVDHSSASGFTVGPEPFDATGALALHRSAPEHDHHNQEPEQDPADSGDHRSHGEAVVGGSGCGFA